MVLELHLGDIHGAGTQSAKKQFINYVSERWSAKVADVANTTERTSETTAHNTAERDATATKQRVSGQCGATVGRQRDLRHHLESHRFEGRWTRHHRTLTQRPLATGLASVHAGTMCWIELTRSLKQIILGSYLRAPTTGAMEASRRVTRYLLGASDAFVKLH